MAQKPHRPDIPRIQVEECDPTQGYVDSDSEENDPEYIQMLKDIKEIKEQAQRTGDDIKILKMTILTPKATDGPARPMALEQLTPTRNGHSPTDEKKQ